MSDDPTEPVHRPAPDDSQSATPTVDSSEASTVISAGASPATTVQMGEVPHGASSNSPVVIGRYRLIEELGKGGFGMVWRAQQTEPIRRDVALKIIKPGMDSREIIARFESERQALALMDHPNIAAVLDAGTTDEGRPYFVMELVNGEPITEYCDSHRLGIRERLELFIPVCQAVQHAHQKGILHRDLKPSNILVTEVDGKPVPKVIDFGIAKALSTNQDELLQAALTLTQEGMVVGTPQYMSPEQAGSVPDVDTRSDVYTLGVILHELLTGHTPLSRDQLRKAAFHEVLRLIREVEITRPSSGLVPITDAVNAVATLRDCDPKKLSATIRGDLDWIVLKALEKTRERRYEAASALARDLQRYLTDEPVSAGPPTFRYRVGKFIRRQRRALIFATIVGVSIIGGLAFGTASLLAERKALGVAAQRGRDVEVALDRYRRTLSTSQFLRAHEHWKSGRAPQAIAFLTQSLRANPESHPARTLLLSLLFQHLWPVPLTETSQKNDRLIERTNPPLRALGADAIFRPADGLQTATLSSDGSFVFTVAKNGLGQVWNASTATVLHSLGAVNSGTFFARGSKLLTTSDAGQAQVWDVLSGHPVGNALQHDTALSFGAISRDERNCLVIGSDGVALLVSLNAAGLQGRRVAIEEPAKSAWFNPDGTKFIVAGDHRGVGGSTKHGKALFAFEATPESVIRSVIYAPDGHRFLVCLGVSGAQLRDSADGRLIKRLGKEEYDSPGSDGAAFSPDSQRLATLEYKSYRIQIWEARDGKLVAETPDDGMESEGIRLTGLQFSPAGDRVAAVAYHYRSVAVGAEFFARVWDAATGQVATNPMVHELAVSKMLFNADGTLVLTASDDKTVQIWDAATGTPVAEPLLHLDEVEPSVVWNDAQTVFTQAGDAAYLWRRPINSTVVPEWFLKFSEKMCGYRLTDTMALVRTDDYVASKAQLVDLVESSPNIYRAYAEWLIEARDDSRGIPNEKQR